MSTEDNFFIRSNAIEMVAIRKIRIRLPPLLFVFYIVAFVDRVNIGFAALTMNRELAITSEQFGFAVGIFFWGYFLFEIPSNQLHPSWTAGVDRTHPDYLGRGGDFDQLCAVRAISSISRDFCSG
jgi:hypothetical protein